MTVSPVIGSDDDSDNSVMIKASVILMTLMMVWDTLVMRNGIIRVGCDARKVVMVGVILRSGTHNGAWGLSDDEGQQYSKLGQSLSIIIMLSVIIAREEGST